MMDKRHIFLTVNDQQISVFVRSRIHLKDLWFKCIIHVFLDGFLIAFYLGLIFIILWTISYTWYSVCSTICTTMTGKLIWVEVTTIFCICLIRIFVLWNSSMKHNDRNKVNVLQFHWFVFSSLMFSSTVTYLETH